MRFHGQRRTGTRSRREPLYHTMKTACFLLLATLFIPFRPAAGDEEPGRPRSFPGYALTDSLEYSAESICYLYDERKVVLEGNAAVRYQGHTLKSGEIVYYQDYDYLEAVGIPDSTGKLTHTPVFIDPDGQEMRGLKIKYNLRTRKGFIQRGRTEYERGFMAAERIKRTAQDTLYIADGTYTTCDIEGKPHYYFAGRKMKFILNDKLIIKPIMGYVHDIPVFWFPFYVFPIKKGRQSGFLTPRYGSSRRDGRYLSNIGYYFAPSEYMDYKIAGTLRERNGWLVNNWFNYNLRYRMSGSVFGSFENRTGYGEDSRQYKFRISHRQTISPTLSITGSGRFESSTYSRYNSRNLFERLNRDMRSDFQITKRWKESGNSLIATASYVRNLDRNTTEVSLPTISFRKQRALLFDSGGEKTRRKYEKTPMDTGDKSWLNSIYYSFNARFRNNDVSRDDGSSNYSRNLNMRTSLSSSRRLMGWLVTEPSMNLSEDFTATNRGAESSRYTRLDNLSMGLKLNTTVYGMFTPSFGNVKALRHVVMPSVSYSYGKRRRFDGEDPDVFFRFDVNEEEKGRTNSMRLSLRNKFQAKTVKGDRENKFDVFTLDFSTAVNFEDPKRRVAPLRTTLDFKPLKVMTTRLTASHEFYDDEDRFHLFSPSLNNLNITTDVGLSGRSIGFMGVSARDNVNVNMGRDDFDTVGAETESTGRTSGGGRMRPFNLSFSHTYGIRRVKRPGKDKYVTTHTIKPRLRFSPSGNFTVMYYCYYNIEDENLVDQRVVVNRDLHCWEASISWVPSGYREGFYFKVNIKELPDVKIEQRRGASRISY